MSLGDYVRYLRAMKGGPDYWTVEEVTRVPGQTMREIEQRYRRVGENDDDLRKLADYFGVPLENLTWRREKWRKQLSEALYSAQTEGRPVRLILRDGPTFEGNVLWWDLGATELELSGGGGRVVVQRHAVDDWMLQWGDDDYAGRSETEGIGRQNSVCLWRRPDGGADFQRTARPDSLCQQPDSSERERV